MGAQSSRHPSSKDLLKVLTAQENVHIHNLHNSIPEPKLANLTNLWKGIVDPHLEELIMNYLSRSKQKTTVEFHDFEKLFAYLVRGTVDNKAEVIIDMLTSFQGTETIPCTIVIEYVESVIKSYIKLHSNYYWKKSSPAEVKCLAVTICQDLSSDVSHQDLRSVISSNPNLSALHASVIGRLYKIKTRKQRLVPIGDNKHVETIVDTASVMYINSALPAALRNEWRILFSSAIHGESFSKLMGFILNKGPTLLVVKDKEGYVFGGFAPEAWMLSPNFLGDDTSFLFSLKPTLQMYNSTQYNDHYQYVNVNQQTMPNGLGMGGQFGFWGLWLDAEFGTGHSSESCTTFRHYKMLSATKNFEINHLEVWAVGPPPVVEEELAERSVLDTNVDAKMLLELTGKQRHSEGLREPEVEDY